MMIIKLIAKKVHNIQNGGELLNSQIWWNIAINITYFISGNIYTSTIFVLRHLR